MESAIVYNGNNNEIDLLLLSDGDPVDPSPVTRVRLRFGETVLDSDVLGLGASQPFDQTVTRTPSIGPFRGQILGVIRCKLGAAGITAGEYRVAVVTDDTDNPDGVIWTEGLPVIVRAGVT